MRNKKDNSKATRFQTNKTGPPDYGQIRDQAQQKVRAIKPPALESMTRKEILQMVYELQVKKIEADVELQQLRSELEERDDQAELFRIISENMLDMVALTDMEGNFTFAGKSHEILGYKPGFLIGKNVMDFVHPEDLQHVRKEFGEFFATSHPRRVEYRYKCEDGHYLWLETVGNFLRDESGAPQKIVFSSRDITNRKQAEQQLKESEERFSKAFRSSPGPQVISDIDAGEFIDVNDRWVEMLGYTRQELIGRSSKEVGIWADPGERDRIVQKLHKNGFFRDEPIEFKTSAGGTVYALWSAEAITLGNRHVMLSMIYDRTGHKQMEDALRESEQRLSLALDAVSDGVWDWRTDTNSVYFSPRWYTMLGYKPYELPEIFETWRRLLHPADLPEAERVLYRHLKSAQPFQLEFRMKAKDGDFKWIFARGKTVEKDAQGNPLRMLGTHMDITGRKQAEKKLRESEEKYRRIAENITDVVWTTDLNLNPTFVSSSIQKLLGETPEEHMRRTMAEKYPPFYLDRIYQVLAEELEKENDPANDKDRSRLIELEHYKADGSTIWVSMNISAIRDENDNLVGLQGVTRDITERKKREQEQEKLRAQLNQAQKMESVGRLAGGVAHDFNNKLSIINGYAEMAMETIDPSHPLQENIREIHTAGKKSADIVRQLLAFARKQTISPVLLDLNDTISSMLKMLQRLIGENINLAWHPGNNLCPVRIDPAQVDQIMANLAVNSRDAISDVGKLTIETSNIVVDEDYCRGNPEAIPGQYVMLTVSDDGCGMEKGVQDLLFEPFFTTKEIGKGTGLGLPTIYGIVKQNKGFINIYSEPGEGTTFKIYLPSHEEKKSSLQSAKEFTGQIPTGTETILVVEDEKTILQMSRQMLERLGYTVQTSGKPSEALQISEEYDGEIDLLITDVVMPEINGRDLSVRLSKNRPGLKTLYMSGYTADVIAHHGVLGKGLKFIQKPFSLKDLAVKVREVLEREQTY
ncbi:MAG: PAS domain S-box protein [Desulfobacterales bacterium]|nr:PAS domain S-box protein [Desulfobacterales bacterium]